MSHPIEDGLIQPNNSRKILTVRSYRATYLCLKDETYTDLYAV